MCIHRHWQCVSGVREDDVPRKWARVHGDSKIERCEGEKMRSVQEDENGCGLWDDPWFLILWLTWKSFPKFFVSFATGRKRRVWNSLEFYCSRLKNIVQHFICSKEICSTRFKLDKETVRECLRVPWYGYMCAVKPSVSNLPFQHQA